MQGTHSVAFRAQRNATECVPYRIRPGSCYPGLNQDQTFRAQLRADAAAMGGRKERIEIETDDIHLGGAELL